jgi:ubiquinone/menaquinone biosynthesis C-methylase UbiE
MEKSEQEKIWDLIAPEWHEYKKIPSIMNMEFLSKCTGNVLDLGAGSGRHLVKIRNGKMWLVDFSQNILDLAKDKAKKEGIEGEFVKSDLSKLPFEDNFFDSGICISALHCVKGEENRLNSVKELYRVLKSGGIARIGVWNYNSKRFKGKKGKNREIGWTDKGKRYYYLYEECEVHDLFKSVGFEILKSENSEMMINFIVKKS